MSNFDPSKFIDLEVSAPIEKRPPLPVGEYTATVGEVTCVPWQSKDGLKSGLKYVVPLTLEVPQAVQQELGLQIATLRMTDGIMLDVTEGGALDLSPGKNGALRRYREALDMNKPGDTFSARKMHGKLITVRVKHELWNDNIQERIDGVARA